MRDSSTVTMQDVAKRAGVSTATVSHVLNNTRFVSQGTREAVLKAIRELNYYPSAVARSLITRKTKTIGMIVSDITNIFFGEIIRGITEVITPYDYGLLLCTTEAREQSLEREEEYLQLLFGRAVDGFIAASTTQLWSTLEVVEALRVPVVFIDRTFEGMRGPFVGVDNSNGAYKAVSHLIEDGHRRIGIVAGLADMSTMRDRVMGFRQALKDHGLSEEPDLEAYSELSIEGGRAATGRLLSLPTPPSAIFANNNLLTLGCLAAIQEAGLKCPDDIGLACFDDPPWATVTRPPLTAVRQPAHEIGRIAADILLRMLRGEDVENRVILQTELIIRESCKAGPH